MQLENLRSGRKTASCFSYFNFERNYDVSKSRSPCILLNKNINFNKNEAESKTENPKHSFRETNFVLQFIWASYIKSRIVMSWSSRKKKTAFFVPFIFSEGNFFLTFVFYLSVYRTKYTFRIYILLHLKNHHFINFCCLLLKSFSVSFSFTGRY